MYCKVCGQEGLEDSKICIYCGSKYDSNSIIPNLSAEIELDEQETEPEQFEPDESENESDIPQDKASSCSRYLWIIFVVLAILIVIVSFLPKFRSMIVRESSSPVVLTKKVYRNSIENVISRLNTADDLSPEDDMSLKYQVNIEIGDILLSILADAMEVDPADIQGLSDILIQCDAAYKDQLLRALYDFNLNDQHIISMEQYVDENQMQQWIVFPEMSQQALSFDMAEQGSASDIFNTGSSGSVQINTDLLRNICVSYIEMFLDGFENVNKSKQTISYNGIDQRLTVIQATISNDQLYRTISAILDDATKNTDVAKIIEDIEVQTGQSYYDDFLETLEQEKSSLEKLYHEHSTYCEFVLYTYLNQYNDIVGMKVEFAEAGELYQLFSCITINKGDQYATEIELGDHLLIQGTGTIDQTLSGVFSLFYDERLLCEIDVKDFISDQNTISGSITIVPTEEIVEHLFDKMGIYEAYLYANRLPDFSVELSFDWNHNDKKIVFSIYTSESLIFRICLLAKLADITEIIFPDNLESGMTDAEQWYLSIDNEAITNIIDRIISSGISRDFFEDEYAMID